MVNTQKNIKYNKNVVLTVFDENWVGLKIFGEAEFFTEGTYYEFCKNNFFNIIKYCNRPYKNKIEMNEDIIKNWNEVVTDEDIIYHLGDFALGSKDDFEKITKRLKGKKILIRGNHDVKASIYEELGFIVLKNAPIRLDKEKLLLSHTPIADKQIPEGYINVHGHIHNKPLNVINEKTEYPPEQYSRKLPICVAVDVTGFKPVEIGRLGVCMNE